MYPGLSELTRIFCEPSSHAILRAIWTTAALEALYPIMFKPCSEKLRPTGMLPDQYHFP